MNYYDILNISKTASKEEIKKAYRKASLKHHPDRGGNTEEFQKVNRAYEVLSDPMKKRDYDMKMSNPFFRQDSNIFSSDNDMGGMGGVGPDDMPDIFKMFFGGGGPINLAEMAGFAGPGGMPGHPNVHIFHNGKPVFRKQMKPSPITKSIIISIANSYTGINYPLEIERWIVTNNIKKMEKETIYVDIPKGVDQNEIIMVEGKGNINENGMQGDVKVYINVENTHNFARNGLDLVYLKKITLKQALVGFKFDIEHLNGKTYTINNNNGKVICPGYKSIINGMGMQRGDKTGKLIIEFSLEFPKNLSEETRKKLNGIL